jgi:hypothetical protein
MRYIVEVKEEGVQWGKLLTVVLAVILIVVFGNR